MTWKLIKDKINSLIFGKSEYLTLRRRIHILITFLTMLLGIVGIVQVLMLDSNLFTIITVTSGFILITFFYLNARNSENHNKTIFPLFIVSIVYIILSWFFDSGYNGTIPILLMSFFIAIFIIIDKNKRIAVFITYLITYTTLIIIAYYYPNYISTYYSEKQRFFDFLTSGIIYLFFLYFIINIIIKNYEAENKKIALINEELRVKNIQVEESHLKLSENNERLSLAMGASKQGWFDYDVPSGKIGRASCRERV